MSRELDGLALVGGAATATGSVLVTQGALSLVMNFACLAFASFVIYRFVLDIKGHDHWAGLRRERKRRRSR